MSYLQTLSIVAIVQLSPCHHKNSNARSQKQSVHETFTNFIAEILLCTSNELNVCVTYAKNPTTYMVKHITIFLLALIVHTQIFVALGLAQNFLDMYGNSKVYPLLSGLKKLSCIFRLTF